MIDAKSLDFTDILKDLLHQNAILVINKSDLLEKDIDPEIKKTNHVLISIKAVSYTHLTLPTKRIV